MAALQDVTAERDRLTAQVQELKAQFQADSTTSSAPPSIDKPWKPQRERVKTERKSGGQPGHAGQTLALSQTPDTVIVLPVTGHCGRGQVWDEVPIHDRLARQVHDLPETRLQVTEYHAEVKICPCCTARQQAVFPTTVPGQVQYGPRVQALTTYLYMVHFVLLARTTEIVSALCGSAPSEGTVVKNLNVGAERLDAFEEYLKAGLGRQAVLYADGTGSKINGKLHWLHIVTCGSLTLYGHHPYRRQGEWFALPVAEHDRLRDILVQHAEQPSERPAPDQVEPVESDLIEQVRQRLSVFGITQDELAKKAFGLQAGRQHVSLYLTGSTGLLTANRMKLLNVLGIKRLLVEWQA